MQGDSTMAGTTRTEIIDLVPIQFLARVAEDFQDSGAAKVQAESNPDGTWKVSAVFRDWQ